MELLKQHSLGNLDADGKTFWPRVPRRRGHQVRGGQGWTRGGTGQDCLPPDVPWDGQVPQPEPGHHPAG